jgi:hypothetical protein
MSSDDWFKPIGDDRPLPKFATPSPNRGKKLTSRFKYKDLKISRNKKKKVKPKKKTKTRDVKPNPNNASARMTAYFEMLAYDDAKEAGQIKESPFF